MGWGIFVSSLGTYNPSGVVIKNNICMDVTGACFYSASAAYISQCDYNLWYKSAGGAATYTQVGGTSYHYNDQTAYKSATGWDTHGLWEDPHFVNAAGLYFNLQAGSSAIDAAVDVGLLLDYAGTSVLRGADMGAYEFVPSLSSPKNVRFIY